MSSANRPSTNSGSRPGTKRPGDDSVHREQPLAKRFHLLNLVDNRDSSHRICTNSNNETGTDSEQNSVRSLNEAPTLMRVDETKNRVFVHDLDEELKLADDVPEHERIVFLPDIEQKLNKIPNQVIGHGTRQPVAGNELVLYDVPRSLSLPIQHDTVRRAILESRARARERYRVEQLPRNDSKRDTGSSAASHSPSTFERPTDVNEDAMEIG